MRSDTGGGERDAHSTTAAASDAAGAVVCLGELVRRADAGNQERPAADVMQDHRLRRAGCAYCLRRENQRRGSEANSRGVDGVDLRHPYIRIADRITWLKRSI